MGDFQTTRAGSRDTILIVQAPRELNHETGQPLRVQVESELPNADGVALILDLTAVDVISSIGVTCLLQMEEMVRDRGGRMLLANVPRTQLEFLKMLRLDRRFGIASNVDDAIVELESGG